MRSIIIALFLALATGTSTGDAPRTLSTIVGELLFCEIPDATFSQILHKFDVETQEYFLLDRFPLLETFRQLVKLRKDSSASEARVELIDRFILHVKSKPDFTLQYASGYLCEAWDVIFIVGAVIGALYMLGKCCGEGRSDPTSEKKKSS